MAARHVRRWARIAIVLCGGVLGSLAVAGCGVGPAISAGSGGHQAHAHTSGTPRKGTHAPTRTGLQPTTPSTQSPSVTPQPASSALPPLQSTTTTTPAATTGFRGIFEFAGNNSSADATNADLAGVVLVYYWSQIEPQKGIFDWALIDNDMAPWVAAGKRVILRISTSGEASWQPPYSGAGTPPWVFSDGTRSISDNGATMPVYWDASYLADYSSFVQSLAHQFDGNANVAFVEPGIGMGGETLPETNASAAGIADWQSAGYTDALWLATVKSIASLFAGSFHHTAIYPLVDMTFFDGNLADYDDLMSWFRSVPNWGLQYDGLTSSQALSAAWVGRPLALEQRNPTRTSHDCLCADIANGLDRLHGNYLLIYKTDIDDAANTGYLRQTAAAARPPP